MGKHIKIWSLVNVDRGSKVRWAATELGYEIEEVRLKYGEHRTDPYRAMNPYGQVPTAEFDGEIMIESTAICLALAERHPEAGLIPEDRFLRDEFWQVLNLAVSTLEIPVVQYALSRMGVIEPAWAELWAGRLTPRLETFAGSVPKEGYFCGEFTLADICAAYVLRTGVQAELLPLEGPLAAYLGRLAARPAAKAARFFEGL
ncbi:MAG: glutathione S-transferase family protein [Lysobacterales bacterium]|jgi:glutathione S-transferase